MISVLLTGGCAAHRQSHAEHGGRLGPSYAPLVAWHSLADGREMAAKLNKPMLVDFAVPENCSRCTFLQENVYNRTAIVGKINADFVPIWVDLTGKLTVEEARLGEAFDYRNDCLLLFLDSRGRVIKDPDGRQLCFVDEIEPKEFIGYLDYVINAYRP